MDIIMRRMFDYLGDCFEAVKWSKSTLTEVGNSLIQEIACNMDPKHAKYIKDAYERDDVLAAKLHALARLVAAHREIESALDYTPLLPELGMLNDQCADAVLTLISWTGDRRYADTIDNAEYMFLELNPWKYKLEFIVRAEARDDQDS